MESEVLVTVEVKWRGVQTSRKSTTGSMCYGRGELSPFCNGISLVYSSRPIASGGQVEKVTSKSKVSSLQKMSWEKDAGRSREDGPRATEI